MPRAKSGGKTRNGSKLMPALRLKFTWGLSASKTLIAPGLKVCCRKNWKVRPACQVQFATVWEKIYPGSMFAR